MSYDDGGAHLAVGATVLSPAKGFQWQSTIAGEGSDASSKLYYLVEASQQVIPVGAAITLNGRPATPVVIDSKQGWGAAAPNEEQLYWKWYVVALPSGPWEAKATIELRDEHAQVSAWVIHDGAPDTSAGGRPWSGSPAFPLQPDCRPQTSLAALPPSPLSDLPREKASRPAEVRTIPGVFLDMLPPASVQQGWGKLQKNQSAGKTPLLIGARNFLRGIGTTGNSRIVYNLDGKYKTFHGVAGTNSHTRGAVTVQFLVDGQKRWQSKLLKAGEEGEEFHVSLADGKSLTIVIAVVGKLENQSTNVDLADAWLGE